MWLGVCGLSLQDLGKHRVRSTLVLRDSIELRLGRGSIDQDWRETFSNCSIVIHFYCSLLCVCVSLFTEVS